MLGKSNLALPLYQLQYYQNQKENLHQFIYNHICAFECIAYLQGHINLLRAYQVPVSS